MADKNTLLKTTLWTILWCLLIGGYGFTLLLAMETKNTFVANDCKYIERDEQMEQRISNKVDGNQDELRQELATLNKNQTEFGTNQKWIMDTLAEIKSGIKNGKD